MCDIRWTRRGTGSGTRHLAAIIAAKRDTLDAHADGESWFSKLKLRCVWLEEFETIDDAREKIGAYMDRHNHRPHSRLAYKTPREVAASWHDPDDHLTPAA